MFLNKAPTGKARGTLNIFCIAAILFYGRFAGIIRLLMRWALPIGEHLAEAKKVFAFIHGESPWSSAQADKNITRLKLDLISRCRTGRKYVPGHRRLNPVL